MEKAAKQENDLHKRNSKKESKKAENSSQTSNTQNAQNANNQENQGGGFSMVKYMCIAFLVMQVGGSFYQMYFLFNPPIELNVQDDPYKYVNFFKENQPFNLTVNLLDPQLRFYKKIWEEPFMTYNYSDKYPITKEIQLEIPKQIWKNNETFYIQGELSAPNFYYGIHREKPIEVKKTQPKNSQGHQVVDEDEENSNYGKSKRYYSEQVTKRILKMRSDPIPLVKHERAFEIIEKNLMESDLEPGNLLKFSDDKTIYPYLKSLIYVTMVHDGHGYYDNEFVAKNMGMYFRDRYELYYSPYFYMNDFWTLKRHLTRITQNSTNLNMTLVFNMISPGKLIFTNAMKMYEAYPGVLDEFKEILSDANIYLLIITMIVTTLHTILDMLSVKNEIQFWLNNKSFKGISVKSVFVQILFDVIIFLYVWDNSKDSSTYILITMGISIAMDVWKVTRVCSFKLIPKFPFIGITYQSDYTQSKTDDYDATAIKFMSMLLFPCFIAYSVYSFMYKPHKGFYSYIVGTLAGGVYLFGFILMTPQLYINYKLKSVTHLPWRALFYKFLNTIIDDLFSFIIKMPMMHRIACFRDDVIFVIYVYQRWAYKVDKSRTDEPESGQVEKTE